MLIATVKQALTLDRLEREFFSKIQDLKLSISLADFIVVKILNDKLLTQPSKESHSRQILLESVYNHKARNDLLQI